MWTQKRIKLGFLLVLSIVLINALVAYDAYQRVLLSTRAVTQTHGKILAINQLLEALLSAETGQRGYVITTAEEYLEPYYQSVSNVSLRLQSLGNMLMEEPDGLQPKEKLNALVAGKLNELAATIQEVKKGNLPQALSIIFSRQGKNHMDQIRELLSHIERQQIALRQQRLDERDALMRRSLLTLGLGTLMTVAMIGVAYQLNRREFQIAAQNKAALEKANALLESRVAERTAQLSLANQELDRSNRELQDFAFVASHDLQEPLRKIQAFGDLLKQDYGSVLGREGCDFIDRMQNASRRMDRLIKDLLAYSRVATKAQPFLPIDLNDIAQEVLNDLEARINQTGGQVILGQLPVIEADALQIRQLLQNLVGNGLKFHRKDVAPVITVSANLPEDASGNGAGVCELAVTDNGIGFDEKYLDRIFTPFQRLHGKNEFEGTGMGLAICRKVVERHGGTLTAQSQLGTGSTFLITLPITHTEKVEIA